jgi:hypothetical protein
MQRFTFNACSRYNWSTPSSNHPQRGIQTGAALPLNIVTTSQRRKGGEKTEEKGNDRKLQIQDQYYRLGDGRNIAY